jgi:hypothetical protein
MRLNSVTMQLLRVCNKARQVIIHPPRLAAFDLYGLIVNR